MLFLAEIMKNKRNYWLRCDYCDIKIFELIGIGAKLLSKNATMSWKWSNVACTLIYVCGYVFFRFSWTIYSPQRLVHFCFSYYFATQRVHSISR